MTWEVLSLAMLKFSYSIYQTDVAQQIAENKSEPIFFENCKEGVSSKTHYQGMDIIQCRLLKTFRYVS